MRAKPATDVNQTRAKARDKSATRLAILDAARRLAAEHGIETLTLASVAAEAGFARATVYGYFKSKDELLQSVVADDVDTLTAAMEHVDWPEAKSPTVERPAEDIAAPAELFAIPPSSDEPSQSEEPQETTVDRFFADLSDANSPVAEAPLTETPSDTLQVVDDRQLRLEHKTELDRILSKLSPSDPEQSEGSAAALTRFDRRLRVVERTVTDLQSQQERVDRSTTTSADFIAESLRGLNQRLEESERRQRESFAELRAGARETARRLDLVEAKPGLAFGSVPQPAPHEDVLPIAVVPETLPIPPPEAGDPPEASTGEAGELKPEAKATYLSAARASARVAAEEAATVPKPRPWLYRIPRKYLMFTCAFMSAVVMVIGVLVVQRATALAARADTISPAVASRAASHLVAVPRRLAEVTPLDELSALAASGNGKAQLIVGLKYLKGEDGPKKPEEAAQWIGRAAQRGEAMAQYWAGYVYQHGIGVSADQDEAMRWYEAAADQGNTKAMYNLGVGYAQGWAGARDVPEASRWFTRAARLGFVDAQFNLAVLYERGQGVPPSLVDAYKWYAVAAKNGDGESRKRLDAIATQLGADDLAAAQRSAVMFQPTPPVPEANTLPSLDLKRT